MKRFFTLMASCAAVLLCGVEVEQNLYKNAEFKYRTLSNGKFNVPYHWYSGIVGPGGKFGKHQAIRVLPIKNPWGYSGALATAEFKDLPNGKYCFTAWTKVSKKQADDVLFYSISVRVIYKNKKPAYITRQYRGSDKPAGGEWVELVNVFEKTPDMDRIYLFFSHCGKKDTAIEYAAPRLVKYVED